MTSLEKAILATLCYADVFDYPLTETEIWRFLIGKKATLSQFRNALESLVKNKIVYQKQGMYYLKGRSFLIALRSERAKIAPKKLLLAQKTAKILSKIPTVQLVGLSGALSMNNAPKEDDIDFFIVTKEKTLWTTRLLCLLILDLLRVRRKPDDTSVKDKVCLNMFVDRGSLSLPRNERDLYSAHEVTQLKPLINKSHTYEFFLIKNKWAKKYLPHAFAVPKLNPSIQVEGWGRGFLIFETLSKKLQLWYMQNKRTKELIKEGIVRFHPVDARGWVLERHLQITKLQSVLLKIN